MATATAFKVENPKSLEDLDSAAMNKDASSTHTLIYSDLGGPKSEGIQEEATAKTSVVGDGAVTDMQKKMKRAERFGVSVHLTEEEKRNTRAERFGTSSAVNGSDSSKRSEDLKRKARAERFGTVQSVSADEEGKKKARLARFGCTSLTDSVEQDKRKARAIRFSKNSMSKEHDKENIEEKSTIAGKAGVGT